MRVWSGINSEHEREHLPRALVNHRDEGSDPALASLAPVGSSSSSSFSRFDRSNINQINVKFISLRWQSGAVETMTRQASDKSAFRGINKFLPFICATQQWFQFFSSRRGRIDEEEIYSAIVLTTKLCICLSFCWCFLSQTTFIFISSTIIVVERASERQLKTEKNISSSRLLLAAKHLNWF